MPVSFRGVVIGKTYTRTKLASLWGYKARRPLERGVATPARDNKIILFATQHQRQAERQFENRFEGKRLLWEGGANHRIEERIRSAEDAGDEIHVFFRESFLDPFTYYGRFRLESAKRVAPKSSRFVFSPEGSA